MRIMPTIALAVLVADCKVTAAVDETPVVTADLPPVTLEQFLKRPTPPLPKPRPKVRTKVRAKPVAPAVVIEQTWSSPMSAPAPQSPVVETGAPGTEPRINLGPPFR
jgi:hypothetical protein